MTRKPISTGSCWSVVGNSTSQEITGRRSTTTRWRPRIWDLPRPKNIHDNSFSHSSRLTLLEELGGHALEIIHRTTVLILIQHRPEHAHQARRVRLRLL